MEKENGRRTSLERIEVDEPRLKALVKAITAAVQLPEGTPLFDRFQEAGSLEERQQAIHEGIYLFRASEAEVSADAARAIAERLLGCLREHIADLQHEWEAIEKGLGGDGEEAPQLLARILLNDERHVVQKAGGWGVAPGSLSFFSLFWARPFRREAAARLTQDLSVESWRMGFCPVCGHWPTFAYLGAEEGERILWCGACMTTWRFERIRCPFCLSTDAEKLPYITVDDDETLPVLVCDECKRYLKHRREEQGASRDSDADYFLTASLDYVAANQGYIQELLISVRFDEPDGEACRAYRARARYEEGPSGPDTVH